MSNAVCPITDLFEDVCWHCGNARDSGFYAGISDNDYHGDKDSLSSSGARKLLPPSCPAIFRYELDHGRPPKTEYDIGHAIHKYVLGEGSEIVEVPHRDWRTAAAKEMREKACALGKVPLLTWQAEEARRIAARVFANPLAAALLEDGVAEQSGWWRDPITGVTCRMRPDWMTWRGDHLFIVDVKSTDKSSPDGFAKSVNDFGYHIQDSWYTEGAHILLPHAEQISFLFITVSKQPPYLVNVCELDDTAKRIGAHLAEQARTIFARCLETNEWPDYGMGPHLISLPAWATRQYEEIL